MGILGLLLNVEVDIVVLHVEADGGSRVAVHHGLRAADGRPLAVVGRAWTERHKTVTELKVDQQN